MGTADFLSTVALVPHENKFQSLPYMPHDSASGMHLSFSRMERSMTGNATSQYVYACHKANMQAPRSTLRGVVWKTLICRLEQRA